MQPLCGRPGCTHRLLVPKRTKFIKVWCPKGWRFPPKIGESSLATCNRVHESASSAGHRCAAVAAGTKVGTAGIGASRSPAGVCSIHPWCQQPGHKHHSSKLSQHHHPLILVCGLQSPQGTAFCYRPLLLHQSPSPGAPPRRRAGAGSPGGEHVFPPHAGDKETGRGESNARRRRLRHGTERRAK